MKTLAKDSLVTRFDSKQTINWISVNHVKMKNSTDVLFPQIVQQERMNLLVWFTVLCVDKYLQNQRVVQNIFGQNDKSWYVWVYALKINDEAFGKFTNGNPL